MQIVLESKLREERNRHSSKTCKVKHKEQQTIILCIFQVLIMWYVKKLRFSNLFLFTTSTCSIYTIKSLPLSYCGPAWWSWGDSFGRGWRAATTHRCWTGWSRLWKWIKFCVGYIFALSLSPCKMCYVELVDFMEWMLIQYEYTKTRIDSVVNLC